MSDGRLRPVRPIDARISDGFRETFIRRLKGLAACRVEEGRPGAVAWADGFTQDLRSRPADERSDGETAVTPLPVAHVRTLLVRIDHLEFRLFAAFLALFGVASAIWPVALNRTFARGVIERYLWDDPGPVLRWIVRLFSVYWALVWGWLAVFVSAPPYFPT